MELLHELSTLPEARQDEVRHVSQGLTPSGVTPSGCMVCPVQIKRLIPGGTLPAGTPTAGGAAACKPPGAGCRTPSQQLAHAAACPSSLIILGCDLNPCIIICLPPAVARKFVRLRCASTGCGRRVNEPKDARRLPLKRSCDLVNCEMGVQKEAKVWTTDW